MAIFLGLVQFRRGPTTDRVQKTFAEGEPIYDTTEKEVYIGDGITPGGVRVGYRVEVVEQATSLVALAKDHNKYTRFSGAGLTYTFDKLQNYLVAREYHGRNVGPGDLNLETANGFIINIPTEGGLVIPPGGTFTVKIVKDGEADLFGITEGV